MVIIDKLLFLMVPLVLGLNESVDPVDFNVLPKKTDLHLYLRALEKIVLSSGTPKNKIDTNLGLGLFLANGSLVYPSTAKSHNINYNNKEIAVRNLRLVNLESAIKTKNMPISLKLQIQRIIKKIKVLLTFFKYIRMNKYDRHELTYLFTDEETWAQRLKRFRPVTDTTLEGFDEKYLANEYSHWSWYEKRILDFENSVPNQEQSDACMISLRWNPLKSRTLPYKCSTPNECQNFVENGSDFGYALVHRLLFLLVARYSRGCYIFSPELDAALVEKMCASVYEEASYIAMNKFRSPDLLMEQISTCSLAGHAEILQRPWLSRLLKQQTPYGCFSAYLNTVHNRVNPLTAGSAITCNSHVSGVAAAALSGASRFIIETYYL